MNPRPCLNRHLLPYCPHQRYDGIARRLRIPAKLAKVEPPTPAYVRDRSSRISRYYARRRTRLDESLLAIKHGPQQSVIGHLGVHLIHPGQWFKEEPRVFGIRTDVHFVNVRRLSAQRQCCGKALTPLRSAD